MKRGFTLIELIIVIAVIAILAGAIFIAVDPARRLHEARNARRWSDVGTIAKAIKTYQTDAGGEHFGRVDDMTVDLYYQIGLDDSGCNRDCVEQTTEDACVDLSGIGSNYLVSVPKDPQTGEDENTAYTIMKDSNGAITVIACDAEGEGPGGTGNVPLIQSSY